MRARIKHRLLLWILSLSFACGGADPTATGSTLAASSPNDDAPPEKAARPPNPKGPEHPVFSLIDNRHLAHISRGGALVVLAGELGFTKYVRFAKPKLTWKLKQTQDGKKVAIPNQYANIEIPLTEAQAAAKEVFLRVYSEANRVVTLKVNGQNISDASLSAGWQTAKWSLPDGSIKAGENTLQLVFGGASKAAVEWLQVGGEPSEEAPPFYDAAQKALHIPKEGGISYYVRVPEGGRLLGDVLGEAGCEITVSARNHEGNEVKGALVNRGAVDLSPLAGSIVRLDLVNQSCPEAKLADASLTTLGEEPKVEKTKKPKYVILWIMDSLRADRVKLFYPSARAEIPNFEKLAPKMAYFTSAYVQGNESRASHASIWTSLYPVNHQMITGKAVLSEKWTTIDEAMKSAGFFNSGVSANGYIIAKWGFGTKWDAYRNHIHDGGGVLGADVLKFALASVEKKIDNPFFLYIGTIDTHVSWRGKEPWFSQYDPEPYNGKFKEFISGKDVELAAAGKLTLTERDKTRIVAMYDSNVSYQDDLVGKLWEKLEEWKIAEDTLVVFTSDHGDEQWEDGRVGHGSSQRETLIHVPLAFYYPPLFPGGPIEEGADTVDILPTLMDALGLPIPEDFQGESLIPLAQGVGRGYPRPSFNSQYEFAHAMRLAGWKMRVAGSGVPSLYDLSSDYLEKKDLAGERPIERRMLTDVFSTFLVYQKEWKKWRWGVPSNVTPQFSADLEG